jgi:ABC-2 type transport system ATP-binding protein
MTDPVETVPDPALEGVSISKRYRRGGVWALKEVDLQIAPGTITALVGPNGAGKTTLIRSFIGFERPTKGKARVMGIDPTVDRKEAIRRVGYVSQSSGLYRGLSVADHLDLAGTLRSGFDRATAAARLEEFGIPLSQRAGDLSGGQAAQVTLSIALGTHATVLLLDEPLASLDPLARRDFLSVLVNEVRGRGATALLSSHIVSDVESVCDSIIVLGSGRVMLHSPIDAALAEHRLIVGALPDGTPVIASFGRPGGEPVFLVRSTDPELRTPNLDELVMGYLAASRPAGAGFPRAA